MAQEIEPSLFLDPWPVPFFSPLTAEGECFLGRGVQNRIDTMASQLFMQYKAHQSAERRTARMFEDLLCHLESVVTGFQHSLSSRDVPKGQISARMDADRSVGILNILWHTVSFAPRNNTKPLALKRSEQEPMFSGRIVAFLGDYTQLCSQNPSQAVGEMIDEELASLYVPSNPVEPAVMRYKDGGEELYFHQMDAPQQFLMKVLEAVCAGGYFHEA